MKHFITLSLLLAGASCDTADQTQRAVSAGKSPAAMSDEEIVALVESSEAQAESALSLANDGLTDLVLGDITSLRSIPSGQLNYLLMGLENASTEARQLPSTSAYALGCMGVGCPAALTLPTDFLTTPQKFYGRRAKVRASRYYASSTLPFWLNWTGFEYYTAVPLLQEVLVRTPMISKVPANVSVVGSCPIGFALNGVRFVHPLHHNLTYQEQFGLECEKLPLEFGIRSMTPLVQKWELTVTLTAPRGNLLTGVGFYHPLHRNQVHEESVQVQHTVGAAMATARCYSTGFISKAPLDIVVACREPGFYAQSIAFHHPMHQNLTYQESVQLNCCSVGGPVFPGF